MLVSSCLGKLLGVGVTRSYGRCIFRSPRKLQSMLHNGCNSLYSHQQWKGVRLAPHLPHCLLFFGFQMMAILTGLKWNLMVIFTCFFLVKIYLQVILSIFSCVCLSSAFQPLKSTYLCPLLLSLLLNWTICFVVVYFLELLIDPGY